MAISIGSCTTTEYPALLAALDAEFVSGRGRTISLARRFPHAVGLAHLRNLHVLRDNGACVACAVSRPFAWNATNQRWHGAMIGMVYTAPVARGQGFASRLLEAVVAQLKAEDFDFAVLWSGLEGFYEHLGWTRAENGLFGEVQHPARAPQVTVHAG
jgi:predicted acetyltransferase